MRDSIRDVVNDQFPEYGYDYFAWMHYYDHTFCNDDTADDKGY